MDYLPSVDVQATEVTTGLPTSSYSFCPLGPLQQPPPHFFKSTLSGVTKLRIAELSCVSSVGGCAE